MTVYSARHLTHPKHTYWMYPLKFEIRPTDMPRSEDGSFCSADAGFYTTIFMFATGYHQDYWRILERCLPTLQTGNMIQCAKWIINYFTFFLQVKRLFFRCRESPQPPKSQFDRSIYIGIYVGFWWFVSVRWLFLSMFIGFVPIFQIASILISQQVADLCAKLLCFFLTECPPHSLATGERLFISLLFKASLWYIW